jgi:iron complex outermembrane receptor protein
MCVATLLAQAVAASEQPSADTASEQSALEEVMVTAEKRKESLQSTPVAVSAFTSERWNASRSRVCNSYSSTSLPWCSHN